MFKKNFLLMSKFYKKVSVTLIFKTLGLGLGFIFQIILGNILNPELYGQYTMILTYTNITTIFVVLGMDKNLIKEISKNSDNTEHNNSLFYFVLKNVLFLYFFISVFLLIFVNFLNISINILLFSVSILLIKILVTVIDGFLQGYGLIVKVSLLNVLLNNILKILLFIFLVKIVADPLIAALFSFIISEVITIVIRVFGIKKLIKGVSCSKQTLERSEKKAFRKYSLMIALIAGIGLLLQNVDKIMISSFLGFGSVGIYKIAQNYITLITIFITPFIAFWPEISRLYSENKIKEIEIEMRKIVKIVSFLSLPMFVIIFLLKGRLLLIFGSSYVTENAEKVLIILSFAFLFDAISGPIGSILTMTKHAKYMLINNIIALIINIIFNFVFMNKYGIVGVAFGTAISIIVSNLISIIEVKILLNIFSYDFKHILLLTSSLLINYFMGKILLEYLHIHNNILYICIFGISIYAINIFVFIVMYKGYNTIVRKGENEIK